MHCVSCKGPFEGDWFLGDILFYVRNPKSMANILSTQGPRRGESVQRDNCRRLTGSRTMSRLGNIGLHLVHLSFLVPDTAAAIRALGSLDVPPITMVEISSGRQPAIIARPPLAKSLSRPQGRITRSRDFGK